MIEALDIVLFPGTVYLVCSIEIGLVGIIGHKAHVKRSLVPAKGCGPHALSVDILLSLQPLSRGGIQHIIYISAVLPIPQIVGSQDLTAGHKMHGSAHHVIGILHPDHVRIGIVQSGDGIDVRILHGPGIRVTSVGFHLPRLPLEVDHTVLLNREDRLQLSVLRDHTSSLYKRICRRPDQFRLLLARIGRFSQIMPYLQRIAGVLIHRLGGQAAFLRTGQFQRHLVPVPCAGIGHIPEHPPVGTILHPTDDCVIVPVDAGALLLL